MSKICMLVKTCLIVTLSATVGFTLGFLGAGPLVVYFMNQAA